MNLVRNAKTSICSDNINYFKETNICEYISIPNGFKGIQKPLNLISDVHLDSIKLFQCESLVSNEGQILTGFNLSINYTIEVNLKYVGSENNSIFFFSFSKPFKHCYIVLPSVINGIKIDDIIHKKLYSINPYLANDDFYLVDSHNFYYNANIIFNFNPLI